MTDISLRPHHLFCLTSFIGNGYSPDFTKNMTRIAKSIMSGAQAMLVAGRDSICAACPNPITIFGVNLVCKEQNVTRIDTSVLNALGKNYNLSTFSRVGTEIFLTADVVLAIRRARLQDPLSTNACAGLCAWHDDCAKIIRHGGPNIVFYPDAIPA